MQRTKNGLHALNVFISESKDFLNCEPRVGDRLRVSGPCTQQQRTCTTNQSANVQKTAYFLLMVHNPKLNVTGMKQQQQKQ